MLIKIGKHTYYNVDQIKRVIDVELMTKIETQAGRRAVPEATTTIYQVGDSTGITYRGTERMDLLRELERIYRHQLYLQEAMSTTTAMSDDEVDEILHGKPEEEYDGGETQEACEREVDTVGA